MQERPELLKGREYLYAFAVFAVLFLLSSAFSYYSYIKFTQKPTTDLTCKVINQYEKSGYHGDFYMLKLDCGEVQIYTSKSLKIGELLGQTVVADFTLDRIDFLGYLKGFYAKSKDFHIAEDESFKAKLNEAIASQHQNKELATLYQALYTNAPQDLVLRQKLSSLGLSHTMSISGFHLGLISGVLFFLFGWLYRPIQSRFFPYRNANRDIFIVVMIFLFGYVWFLEFIPPLLRSFGMLFVGYILYDRGVKIISMQTLFITLLLLMALFVKVVFSLSFWLSASGVFYIFLFAQYTQKMNKILFFFLLPIFVYMAMLPFSLYIFGIFSLVHPLSIVLDELFILFYPLSILLHVSGFGGLFDGWLTELLALGENHAIVHINATLFYFHLLLSLLAVRYRVLFFLLAFESFLLFIYAMQNVA
jgi:competence protein ComEC